MRIRTRIGDMGLPELEREGVAEAKDALSAIRAWTRPGRSDAECTWPAIRDSAEPGRSEEEDVPLPVGESL
jgi:hypothetical protein